ncbi:amidohydrolase family protein [bacterium]|nr:amidohydrolase family protein [bacterium]
MSEPEAPVCGPLIACDALVGAPLVPPSGPVPDVADLEAEMTRLHLSAAVVRHRACRQTSAHLGNNILMDEITGRPHLRPAWFVTPDGREPEFDPAVTLAQMLAAGVRWTWTDPAAQGFSLQPWCSGPLLAALSEHRVPLLLDYASIVLRDLHEAMETFPALRVVLLQVPRVGRNRLVEPLLAAHPELYLGCAPSLSVHAYWPDLCRRFGSHRWLWGNHYPDAEGGAAVTGLLYAGLSPQALQDIAHGNLERLQAEVHA